MKKYFTADVLSLTEIVMGLTLIAMTILETPADVVIWVFIAGQLCDAFDGIAARRWPYPPMDPPYWWRIPRVVQCIEHTSDILLIGALAVYLLTQDNPIIHYLTLFGSVAIIVFCIWIEACIKCLRFQPPLSYEQRRTLIRRRRYVYLLGIAIGIAELIFCTSWPFWLKLALCLVGVVSGIALMILKWDRFTESNETFIDFLRRQRSKRKKPPLTHQ